MQSYRILWTGLGAQLARDVPFSAICWSTLEPVSLEYLSQQVDNDSVRFLDQHTLNLMMLSFVLALQIRRGIHDLVDDEGSVASVLGANFSAGFVAGILAATATCPLDVARTRRQIEVILQYQHLLRLSLRS